ncbi:MAG: STAS domain-containing protein [Acidimicrobiia bacterium]
MGATDGLHFDTRHVDGPTVVTVTGELDSETGASLHDGVQAHATPHTRLCFDFAGVMFMDSTGLSALVRLRPLVRSIEVRNASAPVRRVFHITGVAKYLTIT